jgi:hypothetical protein
MNPKEQFMIEQDYSKLKQRVIENYTKTPVLQLQLLHKIELLELLEQHNPDKASTKQAFSILEKISLKDFTTLDVDILALEKLGKKDIREFSLVRTILSLILIPILLPILLIQMTLIFARTYQYSLMLQSALLATAITATLLCLNPLFLLLTVPAALFTGQFISSLFLNYLTEKMLNEVEKIFSSLFYKHNKDFGQCLAEVKAISEDARYAIDGNAIVRFFKHLYGVKHSVAPIAVETEEFSFENDNDSILGVSDTATEPGRIVSDLSRSRFLGHSYSAASSASMLVDDISSDNNYGISVQC